MGDTDAATGRILVIDDEESMRHALGRGLERAGFTCVEASTGREGADRFAEGHIDAVVTDMRLPDLGGLDLVAIFTESRPGIPVIVMTGYGSVDTALEAMRRGATDYIQKPFRMDEVVRLLARALEERRLQRENRQLRVMVERRFAPDAYATVDAELEAMSTKEGDGEPLGLREAQRRFEIEYVETLLARTGGNVAAAARLAGISRPNFHKKLKNLGVEPARFKAAARRGRSQES